MSELIALKGGLTVPGEPLGLFLELSDRGMTLSVDGEKLRIAGPGGAKPILSEIDSARIVRWKPHLIALVQYEPPADERI